MNSIISFLLVFVSLNYFVFFLENKKTEYEKKTYSNRFRLSIDLFFVSIKESLIIPLILIQKKEDRNYFVIFSAILLFAKYLFFFLLSIRQKRSKFLHSLKIHLTRDERRTATK
jgi:hypothetical protein